jgi:hypothetical protein
MHVMVNEKRFWSRMNAGVGNAAQARCRVASAIKKNVPDERTPCVGGQEEQTTDSMSRVKLKLCADIGPSSGSGSARSGQIREVYPVPVCGAAPLIVPAALVQ